MINKNTHNCTKEVELNTLSITTDSMAKDIIEIKLDLKEIKEFILKFREESDKRYIKLESVKIVLSVIGVTSVIITWGWQILTWFNSL